jgi:hypothetical protein
MWERMNLNLKTKCRQGGNEIRLELMKEEAGIQLM